MSLFTRNNGTREYDSNFGNSSLAPRASTPESEKARLANAEHAPVPLSAAEKIMMQEIVRQRKHQGSPVAPIVLANRVEFLPLPISMPVPHPEPLPGGPVSPNFQYEEKDSSALEFFAAWTKVAKLSSSEYVYLGGTCGGSTWRQALIPRFSQRYFDPVVEDWTPECQKEEEEQKKLASVILYGITSKQKGFYSLVEMAVSTLKHPDKTIVIGFYDHDGPFSEESKSSNKAIADLLGKEPNVKVFTSIVATVIYLNSRLSEVNEDK